MSGLSRYTRLVHSRWRTWRAAALTAAVAGGLVAGYMFGLWDHTRLGDAAALTRTIRAYGAIGPVLYILAYALGVVLFVPGLPMTIVGGVAFGPLWGALYVWIGATAGAALAFLVARYGLRAMVERWVARAPRLARIDAAVARDGWRIVAITRLIPLFPFNLQNYAYGLTRIGFVAYLSTSSICMIPATIAYTFFAGAAFGGDHDLYRTLLYVSLAAALIVLLSWLPRYLRRRSATVGDLLSEP